MKTLKKIEKLEVRFIEGELDKALFEKYSTIYKAEIEALEEKLKTVSLSSSSLEK